MPIDSWFDQVVPAAEARGEARMLQLVGFLRRDDRLDELDRAAQDPAVLQELFREYGIETEAGADRT